MASHRYASSEAYAQGLREAVTAAGGVVPDEFVDYGSMSHFNAEDFQVYEHYLEGRMAEMLSRRDRPTVLFVSFDPTAELVYLVAGRMGIKVPVDLSIVCIGGDRREGAIQRRLTAITVDEADTARQAVDLLVEMQSGRRPIRDQSKMPMPLGVSKGQTLLPLVQAE
jgi:DNA-binding LacI/PurR family transcriptional regulator